MKAQKIDRDRLYMLDREEVSVTAFKALDAVQQDRPEEMIAGVSVLFAALCNRCLVDPHDMHTMGMRMLQHDPHHKNTNDRIETIADFAGLRIMGRER